MEGNAFQGTIPQSLSTLRGIQELDFSRNNLSGRIPEYLESFTSLQKLNLSFNDFEGQVPIQGVFENASGISVIGNGKLCRECEALRNVRHWNLIKILASCSSIDFKGNDFKALVFEYMLIGSLEEWLHPKVDEKHQPRTLNLIQRLNIAIDVAYALDYLHHHCQTPISHSDLKPSNVLLDNDMVAHVSDSGIARFLSVAVDDQFSTNKTNSIAVKGSIGYVAPEYGMGGNVSTSGDVYSYGILLLGLFAGKRPTEDMFKDGLSLH
ncbi:probable LRR receptor-like serine/threonine-protein kinase At3g47570 [Magnolia sinica]|uniref:probable LRR receptor-like serine/threonine-protein kinase At3g47570 n=1 Tax=Magnolia sinica TaxID=86752 RepID=UPI00265A55CD|nr:probable LRR receptor-like serine/threonine-protein kinase At3g47570 [Magnolia sinica]